MNPFFKNLALWLVIGLIMVLVFNIFNQTQPMQKELIFSDFMSKVERGEVAEVTLRGNDITGRLSDNSVFRSYAPDDKDMLPAPAEAGGEDHRQALGRAALVHDIPALLAAHAARSSASGSSSCGRCRGAAPRPSPSARAGPGCSPTSRTR